MYYIRSHKKVIQLFHQRSIHLVNHLDGRLNVMVANLDTNEKFVDLEEAPIAKDNLDQVLQNTVYNNSKHVNVPLNNYRRASINHETTSTGDERKDSRNPTMNIQDAIHMRGMHSELNPDYLNDLFINDTAKQVQSKNAYKTETRTSLYDNEPSFEPEKAINNNSRKSSIFEFENYKKEMYDRVGTE